MENWLQLSLATRMAGLAIVGAAVGGLVNWAIYRLAFRQRSISPWSALDASAPPRRWTDRIPIFGWWGLRRESGIHGRGHWIRPLLIEAALAAFFPWLYQWEVQGGLYQVAGVAIGPGLLEALQGAAHAQVTSHLLLVTLLTAATFIDFDEQTVPDGITIPGTLAAATLAALAPFCLLPVFRAAAGNQLIPEPLLAAPPQRWPESWNALRGLGIALGCHTAWCFALAPKLATLRWGWRRGWRYFWASLWRYNRWQIPLLWVAGAAGIGAAYATCDAAAWRQLLSSILGAALGGGTAWSIRLMGGLALQREALGFGDVTLMTMIGAFLGWQAAVLAFFVAPFVALVIILFQRTFAPYFELAFGPYLAIGAVITLLRWPTMWGATRHYFEFGGILFAALVVCLAPTGLLLYAYRKLTRG